MLVVAWRFVYVCVDRCVFSLVTIVCCLLFALCCVLCVVCCGSCGVRCLLFGARCVLVVVCCLVATLFVVYWLLRVACCPTLVVLSGVG